MLSGMYETVWRLFKPFWNNLAGKFKLLYICRLYEVIDTQTKLYLVLEFADGGDMYDYIMKHEGTDETRGGLT